MPAAGAPCVDDLVRSPAWFPLEPLGADAVRLVQLDEAAYRAASFLDQRLLGEGHAQSACALTLLQAAAARLVPRSHYIFHTGHAGSTLISRLIGAHAGYFALREPAPLRTLALQSASAGGGMSLEVVLALLGRTWRTSQRALIKATSFVSELAEAVLAADGRSVAILVFTDPLSFLRGILAGPNSRTEARQLSPARLGRLVRRFGAGEWRPDARAEGEWIAMSWLCEMTALNQTAVRFPSRVRWVNFDTFLGEPLSGLRAIFRALGSEPGASEIEALVSGPLMRQYSKAPEHAYDAALRRAVLASADHEHGEEIRRGMQWLTQVARRSPLAAAVLELSARVSASG
jgi:hypothetical protein